MTQRRPGNADDVSLLHLLSPTTLPCEAAGQCLDQLKAMNELM